MTVQHSFPRLSSAFDLALLIKAEFKRDLIYMRRYPLEPLSFLFFMYVILIGVFLGMSQLLDENSRGALNREMMILGYCLMQFILASQMGWSGQIQNESQTGTLEQLSISGHRLGTTLFARGIAQFPRHTLSFFILLGCYILSFPDAKITLAAFPRVILILFLTGLGVYGIAYIFAGITLIFKRIGFFFQIANFAFLGLFWQDRSALQEGSIAATLYDIFPLTAGMDNLRRLMIAPVQNGMPPQSDPLFLGFISLISFSGGYLAFALMERHARRKALLSQY